MEDEFIPYEEALALKELGFKEDCIGYFPNKIDGISFSKNKNREGNYIEINKYPQKGISAPTYQQVFRWFREKHNLNCGIAVYNKKFVDEHKLCKPFEPAICNDVESLWSEGYDTYEEAELSSIRELIEIVKDQ